MKSACLSAAVVWFPWNNIQKKRLLLCLFFLGKLANVLLWNFYYNALGAFFDALIQRTDGCTEFLWLLVQPHHSIHCSYKWYINHLKWYPLSKLNTFDWNFMKLGDIVKYHYVFFKFDNGFWKFTIWSDVHSLSRILLIRILWNLVTLLSSMMSFSSLIMVYIGPCFQQLWPFAYENSPF